MAAFRIAFGVLMAVEALRYLGFGWVRKYWIEPRYHFRYFGFEWVEPWPGEGMIWHWVGLGSVAGLIALGLAYRVACLLFFLGFTYVFLLDQAQYLNHFYFICLLSLLLVFVPSHREWSLDASLRGLARTAPAWSIWLLRAQVGLVYFYAGVAKINRDWLDGRPMRQWLAREADDPLLGPWVGEEWFVQLFVWGGLLLDLLAAPALLWRRTRAACFLLLVAFHLGNTYLFSIGIFPWLSIAATTIFFDPDWPRRLLARLRRRPYRTPRRPSAHPPSRVRRRIVLFLSGTWLAAQALVPLRHFLYPGYVSWTEEGHRFAWHMKLRDKRGYALFRVDRPDTGEVRWVQPRELLTPRQVGKMTGRPDMLLQFAHHLAERARRERAGPVEVRAHVRISLNDRPLRLLIDPEVDLAAQRRSLRPADWILPLEDGRRPDLGRNWPRERASSAPSGGRIRSGGRAR